MRRRLSASPPHWQRAAPGEVVPLGALAARQMAESRRTPCMLARIAPCPRTMHRRSTRAVRPMWRPPHAPELARITLIFLTPPLIVYASVVCVFVPQLRKCSAGDSDTSDKDSAWEVPAAARRRAASGPSQGRQTGPRGARGGEASAPHAAELPRRRSARAEPDGFNECGDAPAAECSDRADVAAGGPDGASGTAETEQPRGGRRKRTHSAGAEPGAANSAEHLARRSNGAGAALDSDAAPSQRKRRRRRSAAARADVLDDAEATTRAFDSVADAAEQPQPSPLELGKGLRVHDLGRVEYHNPKFHDRTTIYPVGYHVRARGRLCARYLARCVHAQGR